MAYSIRHYLNYQYWPSTWGSIIAGAAGFKGAKFDTKVVFADLQLVNAASSIIERYFKGDLDQVTGFPISERTYNLSKTVFMIFGPIVIDKYQKQGNFNPNIQYPFR